MSELRRPLLLLLPLSRRVVGGRRREASLAGLTNGVLPPPDDDPPAGGELGAVESASSDKHPPYIRPSPDPTTHLALRSAALDGRFRAQPIPQHHSTQ